jgi:hypothetical protein
MELQDIGLITCVRPLKLLNETSWSTVSTGRFCNSNYEHDFLCFDCCTSSRSGDVNFFGCNALEMLSCLRSECTVSKIFGSSSQF